VAIGAVAACSGQSGTGIGASSGDDGGGSSGNGSSGSGGGNGSGSSTGGASSSSSGTGSSSGSGSSSGGSTSSSGVSSSGSSSGGSSSSSSGSSGAATDAGAAIDSGPIGCGDAGLYNPGSPNAADVASFQQHNLDDVNMYRAMMNLTPLVLDSALSAFALTGSEELACDHTPHGHFIAESMGNPPPLFSMGFNTMAGENQGDPNGWRVLSTDATTNEDMQIDQIMLDMFDEGPPGDAGEHGHYENIMSTEFTKFGAGLIEVDGMLYLTNDFSN
jgi:uncharacterized protein YkwD